MPLFSVVKHLIKVFDSAKQLKAKGSNGHYICAFLPFHYLIGLCVLKKGVTGF